MGSIDKYIRNVAEIDDGLASFDVPDDALERAAGVTPGGAITWAFCTLLGISAAGPL
jgi:hypothetical protein